MSAEPELASHALVAAQADRGRRAWAELGGLAVDIGAADRGHSGKGAQGDRIDAIETVANILHWLDLRGVEEPEWVLVFARRHFNAERRRQWLPDER